MSQRYKIHRWDAVIFKNKEMNPIPTPIIYIKPDENLIKFAKDNSDALLVKLHVPPSIYDQKRVTGVWAKSSDIPNCRAVFFEETELYIIVLQAPWHGYPDCLGECEIFGLTSGVLSETINNVPLKTPITPKQSNEKHDGNIPAEGIVGIVAAFLVLFIAAIFISKN
jgi:hypothetical protein